MHPAGAEGFWRGRGLTILGGALVVVLPFLANWLLWYPAPADRLWLGGDFVEHFAQRAYAYRALAEGRLPLWDPFRETGLPVASYLFDLFNPALLPLAFLLEDGYLRCDVAQLFMVAHLAIGGLGGYLWGLSLNLGRTAACLMGLVLGLNGFLLVKTWGHDLVLHTMAWAPYVFLFLDRARRRASALAGAWAGFFLALVFLGGHPQFFYYVALALAAHFVYWGVGLSRERGPARAWPLIGRMYLPLGLAALLLASPQILHLASTLGSQLTPVLPAGDRTDLIFTQRGSGDPRQLLFLLLPTLADGGSESLVYVGLLPLMLAGLAFHFRKDPESGFFKLLLGLAFLLSLGGSLGLHKVLLDLLPGYAYFRETRRFWVLGMLALAGLAGSGTAWLLSPRPPRGLAAAARGAGWLAAVLAGLALLELVAWRGGVLREGQENLANALTGAALLAASGWWLLRRAAEDRRGSGWRLLLVAVAALDLGFYQLPQTVREPWDFPPDPSRVSAGDEAEARRLAGLAGGQPWRFALKEGAVKPAALYRQGVLTTGGMPPHVERLFPRAYWEISWHPEENPRYLDLMGVRHLAPGDPRQNSHRQDWQVAGFSQAACRLPAGQAVGELSLTAGARFAEGLAPGETLAELALVREGRTVASFPLRLGEELGAKGLGYRLDPPAPADELLIVSRHPRALVRVENLAVNGRPAADRPLLVKENGLWRNQGALPLCHFVSRAAVIGPRGEYLAALASLDPSRCLLFREPPPGYAPPEGVAAGPGGRTEVVAFAPERVEAKVTAAEPGWLVMSQTAFAGWRAELDDRPAPIARAYGFLAAVAVPAGEHRVVFSYREPLMPVGIALAAITLLALLLASGWAWRRTRTRPRPARPSA